MPGTEVTPGREPVQFVEIRQPLCSRTFGVAPCMATGTADQKCYNTRKSCRDPANFALGTPMALVFSRGGVAEQGVTGASYVFPALLSVTTAPTRINLAGSNPDAKGIGNRAVCTVTLADFQHTDRLVDPYVAGRSWNPLAADRGTFWTRWLARNPYRQNIEMVVYDGYAGQALSAMVKRTYFLQDANLSGDKMTITGKDVLARVEDRKAQAPLASPGVLQTDIGFAATSFEATNAVLADYPATGTLRIGNECMTYTGRATTANGVTFTGVSRGTDNTTAEDHSAEDGIQLCLRWHRTPLVDVYEELLSDFSGVATAWLDLAGWHVEADSYLSFYDLTGLVTEPTAVVDLLSEIQIQTVSYLWWDERVALVKLKAVRGIEELPPLLTDAAHIIEDAFSISEKPRERASQVWVSWGQVDPTKGVEDIGNYTATSVFADIGSEADIKYGEPSIRKVFARFLPSGAQADTTASKIITRYVETPSEVQFAMDAKDRAYWVGDTVQISHWRDVDVFGARRIRTWTIVSAEETLPGEVVQYGAEDTTLSGRIAFVMAAGAAGYPGSSAPFKNAYIGDAAGLLSDGTNCARIN